MNNTTIVNLTSSQRIILEIIKKLIITPSAHDLIRGILELGYYTKDQRPLLNNLRSTYYDKIMSHKIDDRIKTQGIVEMINRETFKEFDRYYNNHRKHDNPK